MPVVMVFGLLGNLLSILVLRSSGIDMKVWLDKSWKLFDACFFCKFKFRAWVPLALKVYLNKSSTLFDACFFATLSFEHVLLSSVKKQE